MTLLTVRDVDAYYGKIRALDGMSLEVHAGEIVCLIGANGAGKTTMLKTICGLLKPARGSILLTGRISPACPPMRSCAAALPWYPKAGRSSPA